jgi:hypothetical protein
MLRALAALYAGKSDADIDRELKAGELVERYAMTKPKFKSDAFEAIHDAVSGMYRAGTIGKTTMRQFDETCLAAPTPIQPAQIKRLREANKVKLKYWPRSAMRIKIY